MFLSPRRPGYAESDKEPMGRRAEEGLKMTAQEWLECKDPASMLHYLGGKASERKLRLFAVACCRRITSLLPDTRSQSAVSVLEKYADNQATDQELTDARTANDTVWRSTSQVGLAPSAVACAVHAKQDGSSPATVNAHGASANAAWAAAGVERDLGQKPTRKQSNKHSKERAVQTGFLRCIIGNPFRPVTLNPTWLTPTVKSLAEQIYNDRAFDRMPVLGDALEEAGCTVKEVLEHCRNGGEHVRGCWVVDKVLGKE
jgi:hypothetical protein